MAQIGDKMAIYTEGVMADGACILKDGEKMTISEILVEMNAAAGNVICDACGYWIEPHEPRGGIECDLCEGCIREAEE
jgi:hypothetical protein